MKSSIIIIDDFLPEEKFNQLQEFLMGPFFPWYYNDQVVKNNDGKFQFVHTVYKKDVGSSVFYSHFVECQKLLNVNKIYRIKTNLTVGTSFSQDSVYHTDNLNGAVKTAIFYVNTNNGGTRFKNYGKVQSVSNRMVIFDSDIMHCGATCTNQKRRVVVNFNYE